MIRNLDSKTWRSQTWLGTLFLGLILVVYEWLKDRENKDKDLKKKIYYLTLNTML